MNEGCTHEIPVMSKNMFIQNPSFAVILSVERPYLSNTWYSCLRIETKELFNGWFPNLLTWLIIHLISSFKTEKEKRTKAGTMCKQENDPCVSKSWTRTVG